MLPATHAGAEQSDDTKVAGGSDATESELVTVGDLSEQETRQFLEAETVIREGLQTFVDVGLALLVIRENRRWYLAKGYATFAAYCEGEWSISDRHGRRLIDAAEVVTTLQAGPMGPVSLPKTESQARPLSRLPADEQPEAWQDANARAATEGVPVAARHVEAAVSEAKARVRGALDRTVPDSVSRRSPSDAPMFDGTSGKVEPVSQPATAADNSGPAVPVVQTHFDDGLALAWTRHESETAPYHYRDGYGNDRTGSVEIRLEPSGNYQSRFQWTVYLDNANRGQSESRDGARAKAERLIRDTFLTGTGS